MGLWNGVPDGTMSELASQAMVRLPLAEAISLRTLAETFLAEFRTWCLTKEAALTLQRLPAAA